jgi:hypothetical protein
MIGRWQLKSLAKMREARRQHVLDAQIKVLANPICGQTGKESSTATSG